MYSFIIFEKVIPHLENSDYDDDNDDDYNFYNEA